MPEVFGGAQLVEEHETEPNPDHLKIITGQAPDFWEAVKNDPRCPRQLALAIEEADPSKPYRVRTDNNEYIREIMSDHGWAPPSPCKSDETEAEKESRTTLDQINSKGAYCKDGRGGRIQNRIVGELPYEVSHEQRIRIVRKFAAEFEERNLPYVAVMHAPDHANNDKNWHFHLAYYERPCSRFTGEIEDYAKPLDEKANWHAQARHKAKLEVLESGKLEKYVGQWDFAVPMERKSSSRHKLITYPFAQEKDRDCTRQDWPLKLRKILAEITNDELLIAGAERRVDPRRFAEMGIEKEAEKHLGSRSAQMESLGIATPRGVENEHRQWMYTLQAIEKKFKDDERNTSNEERRWRQTLESRALNASDHSEVSKMITRWSQTQSEANELTAIAVELKKHLERAQSRAQKVEETCRRHIEAIANGQANKRQNDNKGNYEQRLVEATDHLSGLTVIMASEILHEKKAREEAAKKNEEAATLRQAIDKRLKDEMAAMMAAPVKPKEKTAETDKSEKTDKIAENDDAKPQAVVDRSEAEHSVKQIEIERFMKHLVENNRRLQQVGRYVIPVNPTAEENHVVTARNYADHQPRLRKLKQTQDQHVDRLSKYILDHPKSIQIVAGADAGKTIRYELNSKDPVLQRTFKGFGEDRMVRAAIEAAIEARQQGLPSSGRSVSPNTANRAEKPSDEVTALKSGGKDSSSEKPIAVQPRTEPKSASRADVMRKIDLVVEKVYPIIEQVRGGKSTYRLDDKLMNSIGLSAIDINTAQVQARLRGIQKQQDSEIKRLVGFIRRSPGRVEVKQATLFSDEKPIVSLSKNAPADLKALALKYAQHSIAQKQMHNALGKSEDKPEAAKTKEVVKAREKTVLPESPVIDNKKAEPITAAKAKANEPRQVEQSINQKPADKPAQKIDAETERASSVGIDMSRPVELEPADVKKPPRSTNAEKDSSQSNSAPGSSVKKDIPAKQPEDNAKPKAEPRAAPKSERERIVPVTALTAEEEADILRPRKFGSSSGSPVVEQKIETVVHGNEKPAGLNKGVHPKIDAWIEALDARDRVTRQQAALDLKNDRKALKLALEELDAKTQARIRMDWEAQQAKNRDEQTKEAERKKSGTMQHLNQIARFSG
jgi:hypothetical protein